jgi:hypothetical protein
MESPLPGIQPRCHPGKILSPNKFEDQQLLPTRVNQLTTETEVIQSLTMFPGSVEPRAKMKNTSLQGPS